MHLSVISAADFALCLKRQEGSPLSNHMDISPYIRYVVRLLLYTFQLVSIAVSSLVCFPLSTNFLLKR